MKILRAMTAVLLAAALTSVSACDKGPEKIKVGFVTNNTDQFWTIAEAGTKKAADIYKVDVLFRRPPNGTAAEQKEIIEDLLTQGIKAIAISINDPKNQRDFIDQIAEKIPVITQDNDAPDTKRYCYVGTDNYQAGKAAGKLVKEAMPNGGTIAIFVGKPDPLNAQERRQGVLDELAGKKNAEGPKYGKYTLHHGPGYFDYNDGNKAKDNAKDALTDLQNTSDVCFVGLWAYNSPAALSAVKDAGKLGKVKIVAFDEHEDTLRGIEQGHIHATIVQQPYDFGFTSVKFMMSLAKGEDEAVRKGIHHIPFRVIKKNNPNKRDDVVQFHKYLNELLGKTPKTGD